MPTEGHGWHDPGHRPGRPRRWGRGPRPTWWPQGEPWPPRDREAYQGLRRRFLRLFISFAVAALIVIVGLIVGLAWLVGSLLGAEVLTAVLPALALIIGLLIVIRLARGIWRQAVPLGDLIDASERVEAGEIGTQVRVGGPREVRSLARAFNAMSARLAADTDDRRRLLADVSH